MLKSATIKHLTTWSFSQFISGEQKNWIAELSVRENLFSFTILCLQF